MATNGLQDVTWDAGSAKVRWGSLIVPFTKFTRPSVETKVEKIRRVGEMIATKRTAGVVEIGDISAEMLTTDYEEKILQRLPRHGGTLVEFPVTLNHKHPSVPGSYGILMDGCRIIKDESDVGNDEKALITKLTLSVMYVWERGRDGLWKCKALVPSLPSSQARALMSF